MYSIKPIIDPSEQLDGILAASMYQLPAGSASVISCVSSVVRPKCRVPISGAISIETILEQISKVQKVLSFTFDYMVL